MRMGAYMTISTISDSKPPAILFVCLGNICRSPLAEGAARHMAMQRGWKGHIDSAGTGAWHVGNPPDSRSIAIAAEYGVDISEQKARQCSRDDFQLFDLIVAMDASNLRNLEKLRGNAKNHNDRAKLALLLDFVPGHQGADVPDPYYGGDDGFAYVWDLVNRAMPFIFDSLGKPANPE